LRGEPDRKSLEDGSRAGVERGGPHRVEALSIAHHQDLVDRAVCRGLGGEQGEQQSAATGADAGGRLHGVLS
jgi:hypothetical protein